MFNNCRRSVRAAGAMSTPSSPSKTLTPREFIVSKQVFIQTGTAGHQVPVVNVDSALSAVGAQQRQIDSLTAENLRLNEKIQQLCTEISELRLKVEQNEITSQKVSHPSTNTMRDNSSVYETDSDELERETDWILKRKRNKKRKVEQKTPPDKTHKKAVIDESTSHPAKEKAPPPLYLTKMKAEDIKYLTEKIEGLKQDDDYSIKTLANDGLKVNVTTGAFYRRLTTALTDEKKFEWHTYENKNERPHRVMIRYLHPSTPPQDIVEELREKHKLNATKAVNILSRKDKKPLPLFMVFFSAEVEIKEVHELRYLLHYKIKVETPHQKADIPQCKNCQGFGHTRTFCHRKSVCVKCAGGHRTEQCTKTREDPPRCANCRENHPASYRGCEIFHELQKRRKLAKNPNPTIDRGNETVRTKPSSRIETGKSFAKATASRVPVTKKETSSETENEMMKLILDIANRLTKIEDHLQAPSASVKRIK